MDYLVRFETSAKPSTALGAPCETGTPFEMGRAPVQLRVPAGTVLLEATRQAGLPIASACGAEGACSRCGVRILAGAESVPAESEREARAKARNRIDRVLRLACRVRVESDLVVAAPYW